MRYVEISPSRALAPWVKCFWMMVGEGDPAAAAERVVPDGCPEIIVHFGEPFAEQCGPQFVRQGAALIAGQLTRPLWLRSSTQVGIVAARFFPGALFRFLRMPMHALVDQRIPLEAVCSGVAELQERVAAAGSDRLRVALFEQFLLERLPQDEADKANPLSIGTQAILEQGGQLSLRRLAHLTDLTPRQLERRFLAEVGISPKLLCRIVRFRQVFDALQNTAAWPAVALECGFYDQAHLIRDFKQFAGEAPGAYFDAETWFARCFTRPEDVAFFQDSVDPPGETVRRQSQP